MHESCHSNCKSNYGKCVVGNGFNFDDFHDNGDLPDWIESTIISYINILIKEKDVEKLHSHYSDECKKINPLDMFQQKFLAFTNFYGEMDEGITIKYIKKHKTTNIYLTRVEITINKAEFNIDLSLNNNKEIIMFLIGKVRIYHPPSYLNSSRFSVERLSEDPLILYSRPTKADEDFPCALLVHASPNVNVSGNVGFCYPYNDFNFLASANIALLRTEYTEAMLQEPVPLFSFSGALIQAAMLKSEISDIFLILYSYSSVFIDKLLKRYQDVFKGIILVNPIWNVEPGNGIVSLDESKLDGIKVPMLVCYGTNCREVDAKDMSKWDEYCVKHKIQIYKYENCDYYMIPHDTHDINLNTMNEYHVSDVFLRDISKWIRNH